MKTKKQEVKAVKQLSPKSVDTKYMGNELMWQTMPAPDQLKISLTRAFCWYNYYYSNKDAKEFTIDWMARNGRTAHDCRQVARCNDRGFPVTLGWMCRMNLVGWQFSAEDQQYVDQKIQGLILEAGQQVKVNDDEPAPPKPNIQDHLRQKMREAAGEIEGMFDSMVLANIKMGADFKPMSVLRSSNVAPQMVGDIAAHWTKVRQEFTDALRAQDPDLVEGYRNFGKMQIKNMIRFAEQVVSDCAGYVQLKKIERKPRKKKPVSPEKVTSRFKYLNEFAELGLKSVPVTELVDAQEAWLYDTKRRKLVYVVHEDLAGSFTVKGSAIIGFDPSASVRKTLRKPKEQLKTLLAAGAPAARKLFKDIKSTETKFNGRGNSDMIILKVR
jgi:hypothetical protein